MTATTLIGGHEFALPTNPLPPMDVVDVEDLPPVDLFACERCDGTGIRVLYIEAETGLPVDDECDWCTGTGDRRGAVA